MVAGAYRPDSLCWSFGRLARRVWEELRWNHSSDFGFTEPHLTETVLSELAQNHPREVVIRKYSQWEEGRVTGADWEWWLGSPGAWVGMRVQAKLLDSHKLVYSHLAHEGGTPPGRQVDRLIADAGTNRRTPVYCFYNYWRAQSADPNWPCRTYPFDRELWGCAIAHASSVKLCLDQGLNSLSALSGFLRPWMCLVCCRGFIQSDRLADRVRAYLYANLPRPEEAQSALADVVGELPDYAERLLRREKGSEVPENLAGIMVISSQE